MAKMHQIRFRLDSLAGFKGPTSKREEGEEGKGRGRKGPKGREKEPPPPFKMSAYGPVRSH